MPRKEKTNAKTWERDRRNRMNSYFKTLSDLLPPQQEGRKRNKVDILIHASKYIKELSNRTDDLLVAHTGEAHKEELNRLKKLVAQLFSRTQLLSALLKEAGITVPAEPALEKISPLKWSNKINVEDSDKYVDRLVEHKKAEKRKSKPTGYKVPSKQKIVGLLNEASKKFPEVTENLENGLIEDQENHVNSSINESCENLEASPSSSNENASPSRNVPASQHDATPLETPVAKPTKRIRKLESRKKVKRKTKIIDSKLKKKKQHVTSSQGQSIANLLPGTLIWSAGKIVPLVAPITSLTPNILVSAQTQSSSPIILGNAQQNQMIVMQSLANRVQNSVLPVRSETFVKAVQKVTLNGVSNIQANSGTNPRDWSMKNIIEATKIAGRKVILPKGKEITTTTMTYKVPIPAIHREPTASKPLENTENQNSRRSKKVVRSKKTQKCEKTDSEAKETHNEDTSVQKPVEETPESNGKKRKAPEETVLTDASQPKVSKIISPEICNSTETQQSVAEKIISAEIVETSEKDSSSNINEIAFDKSSMQESHQEVESKISNPSSSDKSATNDTSSESTNIIKDVENLSNDEAKMSEDWSERLDSKNKKPDNESSISEISSTEKNTTQVESIEPAGFTEVDEIIANTGDKEKNVCDLGTRFDSLLRATENPDSKIEDNGIVESTKIILNLDTNTTTTMKPEVGSTSIESLNGNVSTSVLTNTADIVDESRINDRTKDETLKSLTYSSINTFVPIGNNRTDGLHSDLSNDLFASLQVPSSSQNPESISPTAAFLMAFPLVSSLNGKTEVLEEEMKEDLKYHSQTPPMLLQIGTMEPNSFKVKNDPPASTIPAEKSIPQDPEISKGRSTSDAPKALPKIINNETVKEPLYKVVQYPETSLRENFTSTPSSVKPSDSANTTIARSEIQAAPIIEDTNVAANVMANESVTHGSSGLKSESSVRKCNNPTNGPLVAKYEEASSGRTTVSSNCSNDPQKYESNGRYPTIPDYVPSYTNFTNLPQQTRPNYGTTKTTLANTSEAATSISSLDSSTSVTYPPMIRSQTSQSAYVPHTTVKESAQSIYANRNKETVANSTESMTSYATFPSVSQSLQHDYLQRSKDSYQSYDINGKENNLAFQGYPGTSAKNTIHESSASQQDRNYVPSRMNDKETLNIFQNYPVVPSQSNNKESTDQRGNAESSNRLNSRDNQRAEAPSRSNNGKIENFVQGTNYPNFSKDSKNDAIVDDGMFQQAKRNESQTYAPYSSRDSKKTIYDASASSSIAQTTKSQIVPNSTVPRYASHQLNSQQQHPCVVSSNYAQSSTIAENSIKSTTTVAHNSSNFSILSWTTFSPLNGSSVGANVGANANANVQYASSHVEQAEPKTSCQNYSYAPIQKEGYGNNILPSEGFSAESPIVEKPRDKLVSQSLKPQIETKVVQSALPDQKISRTHNQSVTTDYKFMGDKSKSKYPMGSAYTQTEFPSLEQQSTKGHQAIAGKSEKSSYIPTYDSQATPFDLPETNATIKCNSEVYSSSSYKYVEDKDANLQIKYQSQSQTTILHHDVASYNSVKHVNQQQQQQSQPQEQQQAMSNKNKAIAQQQQQQLQQQQQQPVRPPVNWMMTPEIKHSTNIADLILPPIGKELEFCQNNIFTQPSSYNQSTPNHQFYNNYETTVSAPHGFPNIPTLQTDPRRIPDSFYSEDQPFSWSPTKNSQIDHNPSQKSMDQHIVVPSTLPTLVGDLALGTNTSEKQNFLFGQMPPRGNKDIGQTSVSKDKDVRDYQTMLNTQNSQQQAIQSTFLSVSQLVEHEKAEKSHQQQNHHSHHNHHHHHHHQQQQQQQSSHQTNQQQTRKHQRKNANANPRTTAKRQIDSRKTTTSSNVVDQLHGQTTEEQKLSTSHTFPDQSYHHHHQQTQQHQQSQQNQKFQQNDVHWRNRQCKSNYTAEALIGGNTNVHDNNTEKQMQASTIKSFTSEYPQNKYPTGLGTADMIMPTINYLSNPSDDPNSYSQSMNQNFNPSSYAYSPNTNIYPTTNFITSISNTPTNYMMPLHDNPSDFMDANSFLLPNVTSSTKTTLNVSSTVSTVTSARLVASSSTLSVPGNSKNQQQQYTSTSSSSSLVKNQNCEKRNSYGTTGTKKSKRKVDNGSMHNLEFPISSIGSQIEDYHSHPHHHSHHHSHTSSFLASPHPNPLYQNHSHAASLSTNSNRISRAGTLSNNAILGHHHPSGTSLTNFNLSTIFPEINDKVTGYKPPNVIPSGLSQTSHHPTVTYPQRGNYAANNTLGHVAQESTQFTTDLPTAPPPGVLHYKNT